MSLPLRIGIVAGEASGDLLGAAIIRCLKQYFPEVEIVGVAGPKMLEAGAISLFPLEKLSVMGLTEVLFHLRELLQLRSTVKQYFLHHPPDIYLGIDSPDFNLPIERVLKKAGILTIHCHSPTIWAWRKNRLYTIGRAVDLMLTLFPFEAQYYKAANIAVKYIGHPLADQISLEDIPLPGKKIIALLPGSRAGEIKYIGPVLLKTAELIFEKHPDSCFISPMINQARYNQFEAQWKALAPKLPLEIVVGKSHEILAKSDIVVLASGTATLEAMLLKRPMVVVYKTSFLTYWIAKQLISIKHIALPNILANETVVPEFIQDQAIPEYIAESVENYLLHPGIIVVLQQKFKMIHQTLRCNAAKTAVETMKNLLYQRKIYAKKQA